MRINKYLAAAGIASRRKSEQLVLEGRVRLNGRKVNDLFVDISETDVITVDGVKVKAKENHVYLMLNKPKGYICSVSDDRGRKTVMELVSSYRDRRLFPVGRLDYDTEGLLIMTTDGDLAQRLTHPKNEIEKTYIAKLEGEVTEDELNRLRNGVILDGVKTNKCILANLGIESNITRIEVIINEGRNRQVRKMFEAINREVIFLKRTAIGGLRLGGLSRGEYRELKEKELSILKTC